MTDSTSYWQASSIRAITPVVGTLMLAAIAVLLAAVLVSGVTAISLESDPPTAAFDLEADGETDTLEIEHVGGETVDVRDLSVTITVEGDTLRYQPPVPFVGADGFDGSPDGPFNDEADPSWERGERVTLTVAETNQPTLNSGDTVTVTLTVDDYRIATLETVAR